MKKVRETKYYLYNDKINKDIQVLSLSDIHFSSKLKNERLDLLIRYIDDINPDYVVIPGDLIDSIDEMQNNKQLERLISFLKKINKRIVLIAMGNHDYYYKKETDTELSNRKNLEIYKNIKDLDNIYILDDNIYIDDNIFVNGISLKLNYYIHRNYKNKREEDKEYLIKYLNDKRDLFNKSSKINISLIHSPIYLKDDDVKIYFKNIDIINSGHMHNGCVFPFIEEIWRSDRGFISPCIKIFPHNTRNTLNKREDKLLVNGAITTFHKRSNFSFLNIFYPSYSSLMIFTNKDEYNKNLIKKEKRTFK